MTRETRTGNPKRGQVLALQIAARCLQVIVRTTIRKERYVSQHTSIHNPHEQNIPPKEVQHTKAGARGVQAGGNAGAMGDPVSDQSRHNYQVSRDTDMTQHADDAARHQQELEAARKT